MQKIKQVIHHHKPTPSEQQPTTTTTTMSTSLSGKVALITGGSKGIGASTAIALHNLGAKISINYGRDTAAADKLVSSLGDKSSIIAIQADASTTSGIDKIISETVSAFGKIDIIVAAAGVLMMKTVSTTSESDFDRSFNLNVKGPYFLVQKALPHMNDGGNIVLFSTTQCTASTVTPPYTLYNATKGAIEQMARTMSKDLSPKGISVNAIAPGPTATDLFLEGKSEQLLKTIASLNPHNRIGEPDEVADAIVFLCSSQSRWVSGQTLRVNGGQA
jgi:3-oxoacyl-[acyl-carrier protein] reductase